MRVSFRSLAALTLVTSCLAAAPAFAQPGAKPSKEQVQQATSAFQKGMGHWEKKQYAEALAAFQQSYDTVPSPNSLLYVARCHAQLGDSAKAFATFDRVDVEATARVASEPKYGPTRDTARVERDELKAKLVLLQVKVANAGEGTLKVGNLEVPHQRWADPIPAAPGAIEITLTTPSGTVKKSVEGKAGEKLEVLVDASPQPTAPVTGPTTQPEPAKAKEPLHPLVLGSLAGFGVGVVGIVMFAAGGSMSNDTYKKLEASCGTGRCPESLRGDVEGGKTQQAVANAGLVIGGVGLAAGATMLVLGLTAKKPAKEASALPRALPLVGPGFVGVHARF